MQVEDVWHHHQKRNLEALNIPLQGRRRNRGKILELDPSSPSVDAFPISHLRFLLSVR